MKFVFGAIVAVFLSTQVNAQNLDDGFSPLKLFVSTENIEGLQSVELEELWFAQEESEWMTTAYATFDVGNFKMNEFFGLAIDRAEVVIMEPDENGNGTIWQFTLLIEDPGANAYNAFMDDIESAYGPIFTYSIHEDDTESPNWFSEETLLTVSGSKHRIEHNGKKYIMVQFMSGVGG